MEQHQRDVQQLNDQNQLQNDINQLQDMHDPYLNPGQDIVVDEHHHSFDHGFNDSGHHDHF